MKCHIYHPFFTRKATISEKNSFRRPFFYSVHPFARIRQHYFSKYWGTNACMGRPPPQIFLGGTVPQSPRSPPLLGTGVPTRTCGSCKLQAPKARNCDCRRQEAPDNNA